MTGLFLIVIALIWLIIVLWITKQITKRFRIQNIKRLAAVVLIPILLLLPISDELIGRAQFQKLCQEKSVLRINEEKIKGKLVRLLINPSWREVTGAAIPMAYSSFNYLDAVTNERYAEYSIVRVKGGLLIRLLGISEGNAPLTLNRTSCSPEVSANTLAKKFEFKLVE